MKILIHLRSEVGVFQASRAQTDRLAARMPMHEILPVESKEALLSALPEADAAVVWSFPEKWYAVAPRLRHVFTPAAGRERIAPDPGGKVVRHFGSFHGALMAESLLGMMYFMNRRFGAVLANQRRRDWDPKICEDTRRLAGQAALIVGYGNIGRRAATLLTAVGVRVYGLKRDPGRGGEGAIRIFARDELYAAIGLADHVVCLLPADTGTDRLLDGAALACCKPGAFVYNLGRGNAVDLEAVVQALATGRLGGAFLDVFPDEPLPADSPLWSVPNLYLTPHASAVYAEYLDLYFDELALLLLDMPV
jgi:D-2-hydroxyacid dehydrogenase (NADP+)